MSPQGSQLLPAHRIIVGPSVSTRNPLCLTWSTCFLWQNQRNIPKISKNSEDFVRRRRDKELHDIWSAFVASQVRLHTPPLAREAACWRGCLGRGSFFQGKAREEVQAQHLDPLRSAPIRSNCCCWGVPSSECLQQTASVATSPPPPPPSCYPHHPLGRADRCALLCVSFDLRSLSSNWSNSWPAPAQAPSTVHIIW